MEDVSQRPEEAVKKASPLDSLGEPLAQSSAGLGDPLSQARPPMASPAIAASAAAGQQADEKDKSAPKDDSKPKEKAGNAELKPANVGAQVDKVLNMQGGRKDQIAFVKLQMMQDKTFIPALAARGGQPLLNELVEGSASDYIPSFGRLVDIFGLIPTVPTAGGGFVQAFVIGLPVGAVFGALGAIQSLVGRLFSAFPGSHRDTIATVMTQQYNLELESSWTEGSLRSMYLTFSRLPPGHVSQTVKTIKHNPAMGSDFAASSKDDKDKGADKRGTIGMARLLPTSISMGSGEMGSRLFAKKFLKTNSVYSSRMRTKNAFTMTTLHEVGHAVDERRNIMSSYMSSSSFGGWEVFTKGMAVDRMLESYAGPKVEFSPEEANTLEQNGGKMHHAFLQLEGKPIKNDEQDKKYRDGLRADRKKMMDENTAIEEGAKTRAYKAAFGVSHTALREIFQAVMKGTKVSDAVAANKETAALSWWQRRGVVSKLEEHPIYLMIDSGNGSRGWMRTTADLAKLSQPFGGKAYHQSYPSESNDRDHESSWCSYEVAQKKHAVSHYQWRAPGEWFAELYAHYFMGTLSGHPMEGWMRSEIATTIDPGTGKPTSPEAEQEEVADAKKGRRNSQAQVDNRH